MKKKDVLRSWIFIRDHNHLSQAHEPLWNLSWINFRLYELLFYQDLVRSCCHSRYLYLCASFEFHPYLLHVKRLTLEYVYAVTEDFTCPFCLVKCASFKVLSNLIFLMMFKCKRFYGLRINSCSLSNRVWDIICPPATTSSTLNFGLVKLIWVVNFTFNKEE